MKMQALYFLTFLLLLSSSAAQPGLPTTTFYVDRSGNGNFSTLQAAIDSVPANNQAWIQINVATGVYTEKVTIPADKPFLYIQGMGVMNTRVEWNDSNNISVCSTFSSLADNIVVRNITFTNTFHYPWENNGDPRIPAVAAKVSGDKTAFYGVAFIGIQDTLYDHNGRHYFHSCTIEGAVDFIFGTGQSIYENCMISVSGGGAITAQGRLNPYDTNGFVFRECKIFGKGPTLLGRAWKAYSRILFIQTTMEDVIAPEGWDIWNKNENDLTFGEYNCSGPGASTSGRVSWETMVTPIMAENFGNIAYIDVEGWIANQPHQSVDMKPQYDGNSIMQYDENSGSMIFCNKILVIIFICIVTLIII